jgi:thiamine transport system ATP-binding protein
MTLELEQVEVRYDDVPAVAAVDLRVDDGEVLAVLGPSGCGKSTLLRAVAGLEPLAAGTVAWDGADLARVPTHRRGFALMFQDGQLFDHLTVARNVGYALRLRDVSRSEEVTRVADLLASVGLQGYGDRLPTTLSGGERQRVALARSLAAEPRLVLLDEPLSSLDAALRARLATELRQILTSVGSTALFVTHDQAEAFAIADRVAVMREGRIVQQGPVHEVWSAPVDAETALFLGYAHVLEHDAAATVAAAAGLDLDGRPAVAVRRSALTAVPDADAAPLAATVRSVTRTPDQLQLRVGADGVGDLEAVGRAGWRPEPGDRVGLRVDANRLARLGDSGPRPAI